MNTSCSFLGNVDAVFRSGDGVLMIRTQTTQHWNKGLNNSAFSMLNQTHAAINIIMVAVLVHVWAVQMNCGPLSSVHKKFLYHFMTFVKQALWEDWSQIHVHSHVAPLQSQISIMLKMCDYLGDSRQQSPAEVNLWGSFYHVRLLFYCLIIIRSLGPRPNDLKYSFPIGQPLLSPQSNAKRRAAQQHPALSAALLLKETHTAASHHGSPTH